jgi:tRNA(fMet)-specific endonuclease VapC
MTLRYLLDTNTASYIIKGDPPQVRQRLLHVPMEAVAISAITEAELRYGGARKPQAHGLHTAIEEFIIRVDVLPWDRDAARSYAVLRAALAAKGIALGAMDMLIAAHALASRSTLITSHKAFSQVEQLQVEDWAA